MLKRAIILAFVSIMIVFCSHNGLSKDSSCIDWPRAMTLYEMDRGPQSPVVQISPFTDYTKQAGDEWLAFGLRDYLADLLRASGSLKVLAGNTAGKAPPDYSIGGMFQHGKDSLRVFISVADGKSSQLLRQIEMVFPWPDNSGFFTKIADAANQIIDVTGAKKSSSLNSVRDATSSTRAYENFAKGRQALEAFSPAKAESAALFFEETKRYDNKSPLGFLGMMDLNIFLGFYHKQRKEAFSSFFQKAEREMVEMLSQKKPPPRAPLDSMISGEKAGVKSAKPVNRFLLGNAAFIEGQAAEQAADFARAADAYKKSVDLVPEDAISWYYLSRMEARRGNADASRDALQKAYGINSCIEMQ